MNRKQIVVVLALALVVGAFFVFDVADYLTLEYLQASRERATAFVTAQPLAASLAFFVFYVVVTGASLPGAAVMTLAAGAVFGLLWGVLLVSFASTVGATFAFLVARTLLHDWVQRRYGHQLEPINKGFEKDGNFYLFGLRMVPLFPFFIVNLLMGLTPIRVLPFYLVSQVGMLAGTFVYVFAGTQLAEIRSLGDILSPGLLAAFTLLGLFPLLAKKAMGWVGARRDGASA